MARAGTSLVHYDLYFGMILVETILVILRMNSSDNTRLLHDIHVFLPAYAITLKDSQTKKFELRIKLANLQQTDTETIAEYLKRAGELSLKLPLDDIDVGMGTLKGMRDVDKRERVSFECNKDADYSYPNVTKLIKAAYSEIGKTSPFDPGYKQGALHRGP